MVKLKKKKEGAAGLGRYKAQQAEQPSPAAEGIGFLSSPLCSVKAEREERGASGSAAAAANGARALRGGPCRARACRWRCLYPLQSLR